MFPTAGMYVDEAADYLEAYANELETSHHFYPRAESLAALLANMQQYLDASVTQLSDSSNIEWMMGYYPFQLAQGRIHAILGLLRAINVDFQSVIVTKAGSQGPLNRTIVHLGNGLEMSPWFIMNKWMGYNDLGTLLQSISPAAPELAQFTNIVRGTNSR